MRTAASSGNIAAVMSLINGAATLKPTDFIKKTVGATLFMYYMYVDALHVKPRDCDDLVDGLLFLEAKQYSLEQERKQRESAKPSSR